MIGFVFTFSISWYEFANCFWEIQIFYFSNLFFFKVLLAGGTHDFRHFSGNELSEIWKLAKPFIDSWNAGWARNLNYIPLNPLIFHVMKQPAPGSQNLHLLNLGWEAVSGLLAQCSAASFASSSRSGQETWISLGSRQMWVSGLWGVGRGLNRELMLVFSPLQASCWHVDGDPMLVILLIFLGKSKDSIFKRNFMISGFFLLSEFNDFTILSGPS